MNALYECVCTSTSPLTLVYLSNLKLKCTQAHLTFLYTCESVFLDQIILPVLLWLLLLLLDFCEQSLAYGGIRFVRVIHDHTCVVKRARTPTTACTQNCCTTHAIHWTGHFCQDKKKYHSHWGREEIHKVQIHMLNSLATLKGPLIFMIIWVDANSAINKQRFYFYSTNSDGTI